METGKNPPGSLLHPMLPGGRQIYSTRAAAERRRREPRGESPGVGYGFHSKLRFGGGGGKEGVDSIYGRCWGTGRQSLSLICCTVEARPMYRDRAPTEAYHL